MKQALAILARQSFDGKTVSFVERSLLSSCAMAAPHLSPQERIALLVKAKQRESNLGTRASALAAGISAATMSRLARPDSNTLPDIGTLTKLSIWLDLSVSALLEEDHSQNATSNLKASTPDLVEVHLRADKNLAPEAAQALAQTFKAIYEQVVKHGIPRK